MNIMAGKPFSISCNLAAQNPGAGSQAWDEPVGEAILRQL
jgi:hypothetical protein